MSKEERDLIEAGLHHVCSLEKERDALLDALTDVQKLYHELIYAVGTKFKDETRHETALRYIKKAENRDVELARQALSRIGKEGV